MASITITGVILAPMADLSNTLILNAGVKATGSDKVEGDFRTYASGCTKLIVQEGEAETFTVTAALQTEATHTALKALRASLLLLRDGRGHCIPGSFLDVGHEPVPSDPEKRVNLSFVYKEITHSFEA